MTNIELIKTTLINTGISEKFIIGNDKDGDYKLLPKPDCNAREIVQAMQALTWIGLPCGYFCSEERQILIYNSADTIPCAQPWPHNMN